MSSRQAVISPRAFLSYVSRRDAGEEHLEVSAVAVMAWGPLCNALVRMKSARRRRDWPYDAEWPHYATRGAAGISIFRMPTGAPAAAFLLEQIIACGAETIVGLGIAGSLDPELTPGAVLIAAHAFVGEGTSPHYGVARRLHPPPVIPASALLVARLSRTFAEHGDAEGPVRTGTAWSTDAPFRELRGDIATKRAQGALVVDMETSAMYSVARFRGVRACNLLVISDELTGGWRPGLDRPEFTDAATHACKVLSSLVSVRG
jgi:uridine phosphorylase